MKGAFVSYTSARAQEEATSQLVTKDFKPLSYWKNVMGCTDAELEAIQTNSASMFLDDFGVILGVTANTVVRTPRVVLLVLNGRGEISNSRPMKFII